MHADPEISWPRLAAFVRQHTHDVRNGLNSLDLETALLQEIVTDPEGRACVDRVRKQVRGLAEQLRAISALFQEPQPYRAPLHARELMLIWREQLAALPEPPSVNWVEQIAEEKVDVDAGMMGTVFRELLMNARSFRDGAPATASVRREGDQVFFDLREPKSNAVDTGGWGSQVLHSTKRGGYGLGLWNVKRLAELNGATITHTAEDKVLLTRIALPVCP